MHCRPDIQLPQHRSSGMLESAVDGCSCRQPATVACCTERRTMLNLLAPLVWARGRAPIAGIDGAMAGPLPVAPSAAERAASASTVFAFVVDHRMWRHAAVAIQQLNSLRTALPIVVFNHTALPAKARQAFTSLGALSLSLEPPMPIPAAFAQHFESRRNLIYSWPKLGVW